MDIFVTQNAGFCVGVRRAVGLAMAQNSGSFTYGDIVNNSKVVRELEEKGIKSVSDISDIPNGATVVIRAHGVPKNDYEKLMKKNVKIIDGTCPSVAKVQKIVSEYYLKGYKIVILGDKKTHPETIGNNGWCENKAIIIENNQLIMNDAFEELDKNDRICAVACTTVSQEKWNELKDFLNRNFENAESFDTICNATKRAQDEAAQMAMDADAMIVIGDKKSSNSNKLNDICRARCANTQFVNDVNEVDFGALGTCGKVGIVAGLSTTDGLIGEICEEIRALNKMINDK